ncbi:AcrR family transcriptional regulator [Parvibaculum indicum]|uniref:TetR/AcrR family transcriptional regulator n=1 Tax=Parvibaculum indicum TaxID=562969 RepID=UPI00141E1A9E|nr:TetR/AcrR family transcriptional regulator [Parvibaculum indicum]NIJ40681.1 AcrR family transcriptional regulator [Parvibaculum indicum]
MARIVDRDAKRQKILEAASACFAREGYDSTSMEAVAAAAGISKGSLYDYFKNKEDLFFGVFEWFQQLIMVSAMERMGDYKDARERIMAFADASIGALLEHLALYPVSLEVWAAAAKPATRDRFSDAMKNLYASYRAELAGLIREAQAEGAIRQDIDVEATAGMLIGAVDNLALHYWLDRSFDPQAWCRAFLGSLFDGIGTDTRKAQ